MVPPSSKATTLFPSDWFIERLYMSIASWSGISSARLMGRQVQLSTLRIFLVMKDLVMEDISYKLCSTHLTVGTDSVRTRLPFRDLKSCRHISRSDSGHGERMAKNLFYNVAAPGHTFHRVLFSPESVGKTEWSTSGTAGKSQNLTPNNSERELQPQKPLKPLMPDSSRLLSTTSTSTVTQILLPTTGQRQQSAS
ncbi:hypothetical protein PGT21_013787 [Puccinia graminis f. sp. tritici]|uniref:Uncharacterized protein n=1 Tax=Puccinia graminis f. sp. tritici TaxID=56615 RepID=A0A5B0LKI4_PUCGR|nr:hypothetical protein PGT21_013787 [Puccinia graminis f. sp. tritici]KAA1068224.1 hypothetical protein PGTUg99_028030 [Puccinia graminis f. sp. tritici]